MEIRKIICLKIGRIILALCLAISVTLCGCSTNTNNEILSTAISQINQKANGHIEQLNDYNSPYTVCYKNKDDTYSFYIFASPIQYKTENGEYAIIDNTVVESNKNGFVFENKANSIKTYFPKTLSDPFRVENGADYLEFKPNWNVEGFTEANQSVFTNMYGDKVSAVIYERSDMDIAFYPTKSGIKTEIVLKVKPESNEFAFTVKSGAISFENKQNGYILFKNGGGENQSIIYQPIVQYTADNEQQLDVTAQLNINREEDDYYVEMIVDDGIIKDKKYPVKFDPSFEMHFSKMPDSTVYSKRRINNYLASYAVVGEHPVTGEGWHYLRFRLNWFMELNVNKIRKATYNIRSLSIYKNNSKLNLLDMDEQWTSTSILWNTRSKNFSDYLEDIVKKDNFVRFNVTDFLKMSFEDKSWAEESNGLVLKAKHPETFVILATSDNSLYPPYIQIDMKTLPTVFDPQENINPPM